ncbi:MAG: ABC transporter permease [Deltaproteobacteria bacterium]
MKSISSAWKKELGGSAFAVLISALLTSAVLIFLGESPSILWEAFTSTFFNSFGLGYTLYYTTPLILTGLSVSLCFHAGLFNIGSEGQLHLGAVAVIALAFFFPNLPWFFAIPCGILVAGLAGGFWGWIAGFLKAKRGSHEVIVTILLNFIAITGVNYLILYPFKNHSVQNPETIAISKPFFIPRLSELTGYFGSEIFRTTPVNFTLFFSVLVAIALHLFLFHTSRGYEFRAMGQNSSAAKFNGVNLSRNVLIAFFLGGALSGFVGVNEIMGFQHKLIEGFSPQYGFTGIAVALMARNRPLGVILAALLFGSIHNGAREIEFLSEKITKEISIVMESILVILIAGHSYFASAFMKLFKGGSND